MVSQKLPRIKFQIKNSDEVMILKLLIVVIIQRIYVVTVLTVI